jgi:O-antigen/teichoic acid export membrane protein
VSATENVAAAEPAPFTPAEPIREVVVDRPPDGSAPDHLERSVGIGVVWKLVGQFGVQGIRLVTVAILARILTPADYGAAALAIALASFAPTVADMGMGAALVQTDRATRVVRSTVFWASLSFGVAFSVLAAVAAGPIGRFLDDPRIGTIVAVGGLTFAICALASTSQAVFMREMKFRSIELRFWFALVVASGLAVMAATLGAGAWALVLQQVVLLATFAVALWWRAGWHPTFEFSGSVFRRLGSFAVRVAGGRWARLAELLVLSLLIGKLVGVPALGAWSFAMSTVILPLTVIAIPIAEVLFSAFSRLRGDRERMTALWLESNRFLAAVILPVLVGLVVVAPDLIPAVFGSHWHVSVGIIQILSIYVIIRSLQSWNSVVMDAVGRPGDAVDPARGPVFDSGGGRHRLTVERRGGGSRLRPKPAVCSRDSDADHRSLGTSGLPDNPGGAPLRRSRRHPRDGNRMPARTPDAFGTRRGHRRASRADDCARTARVRTGPMVARSRYPSAGGRCRPAACRGAEVRPPPARLAGLKGCPLRGRGPFRRFDAWKAGALVLGLAATSPVAGVICAGGGNPSLLVSNSRNAMIQSGERTWFLGLGLGTPAGLPGGQAL